MGEKMHERALGDLQLEVVALRAELARVQGAVRLLAEALELEIVVEGGGILGPRAVARILAALDAPAPDAAPEPMPDVWWGACDCGAAGFWTPGTVRYVNCPKCFGPRTKGAPAPGLDAAMAAVAKAKAAASGSYAELRPTPPADAPLPGPVAFADRYGGLPVEVADAIRAILQARAVGGLGYADASNTADALAAFWRAQQQPALGDEVRAAMREACYLMQWASHGSGTLPMLANDLRDSAARLRELAGECGADSQRSPAGGRASHERTSNLSLMRRSGGDHSCMREAWCY